MAGSRMQKLLPHGESVPAPRRELELAAAPPYLSAAPCHRLERHAAVAADVRIAADKRIVHEARIAEGVLDGEEALLPDRVQADREAPLRLAGADAARGLEPLPLLVDQRHQRDGMAELNHLHVRPNRKSDLAPALELAFVDEHTEAALLRAVEAGAELVHAVVVKPWGQRVGHAKDLNEVLVEICSLGT